MNTTFEDNIAQGSGGALFVQAESGVVDVPTLCKTAFSLILRDNHAGGSGGGLFLKFKTQASQRRPTLLSCPAPVIDSNQAQQYGNNVASNPAEIRVKQPPATSVIPSLSPRMKMRLIVADSFNQLCIGSSFQEAIIRFVTRPSMHIAGRSLCLGLRGGALSVGDVASTCEFGIRDGRLGQKFKITVVGEGKLLKGINNVTTHSISVANCGSDLPYTCRCDDPICGCKHTNATVPSGFMCTAPPASSSLSLIHI